MRIRTATTIGLFTLALSITEAASPPTMRVAVYVTATAQPVSPEGFVDGSDKGLQDSVKDLTEALHEKDFHPNKGFPGSPERYVVVPTEDAADITLTVVARGASAMSLGQRTTMEFYRGVVMAETVPTVGVTRWVSMVLSVGSYKKEFVTWSTNRSRWSAGAWTADAKLLARIAAGWVMANEPKILERQQSRPSTVARSMSDTSPKNQDALTWNHQAPPAVARQRQPPALLFEFLREIDKVRIRGELRDDGQFGFDVQIFRNEEFFHSRRFFDRPLAEHWAQQERRALEQYDPDAPI